MKKEEYGDQYHDHLLEQYKIVADNVKSLGARRAQTNRFYISILSGLIVIVSLFTKEKIFSEFQNILLMAISIIGIALCFIWSKNIRSLGITSARRYQIINEIEKELPYPCFSRAWELLQKEDKYTPMAKIESLIPIILLIPYILLLCYSFYVLIK